MPPQRQHDPTLPRPWEALFDTDSGLRYFWNPETNVTQYERPAGGPPPPTVNAPSYVRETEPSRCITTESRLS
jgi:ATP-dependent RNA helicase DDX5/DBP2